MNTSLSEIAARMRQARRITAITGAGVSAASGVPTFAATADCGGTSAPKTWRRLTHSAVTRQLVWEWYDWRRSLIAACTPNPAHDVLARWSQAEGFTLITQNVDGLHERAGARVLRFHGSIWELRCAAGCHAAPWEDRRAPLPDLPPRCPGCGDLARPGVVWFGEGIDPDVLRRAFAATDCDVFLSIGTSSLVYPAAGLADDANGAAHPRPKSTRWRRVGGMWTWRSRCRRKGAAGDRRTAEA